MTDRHDTHVEWWDEPEGKAIVFSGRLNFHDIADLRLDQVERAAITAPIETAADLFQTLEIIFRRKAEQARDDKR